MIFPLRSNLFMLHPFLNHFTRWTWRNRSYSLKKTQKIFTRPFLKSWKLFWGTKKGVSHFKLLTYCDTPLFVIRSLFCFYFLHFFLITFPFCLKSKTSHSFKYIFTILFLLLSHSQNMALNHFRHAVHSPFSSFYLLSLPKLHPQTLFRINHAS